MRRTVYEQLSEIRLKNYVRKEHQLVKTSHPYPETKLDFMYNVSNKWARKFYERHGVTEIEKAFELLRGLLKKENSFDYYFDFSKVLFDSEFWKDKKGSELIELFTNYVVTESNDEQKYELFLKGYVKNVPLNIVRQNIHQLENEDCKKIFKSISENKPYIRDILTEKVKLENTGSLSWLYDLAIEFLDQENFNSFDNKAFNTIEQSEYFKFWEKGKAKIFPKNQIDQILQDKFENYAQIKKWNETTVNKK